MAVEWYSRENDDVPPELVVRLLDHALGREIDLRHSSSYPFVSTRHVPVARSSESRFELLAGTPAFVASSGRAASPMATRLLPSFPSPMTSASTIRFELDRPGPVRLDVFDVSGRHVRELVRGEQAAGAHELSWAGRDDDGRALPPGVYLLRLAAVNRMVEQRVVKLR